VNGLGKKDAGFRAGKAVARMAGLTDTERSEIIRTIEAGGNLPLCFKHMLFPPERQECELVYAGKEREEDILADTWGVPLQAIKTFSPNGPGWHNRLIFGDNLQAMKTLLDDPEVKGKVKLVYIDPPFGTKRDFQGKNEQKAYQDRVAGAEFVEFLRRRLVFIRELLSLDGSVLVHLDYKKCHYVDASLRTAETVCQI
jgi:site-specific DNA-methyltransferase (adenine-specific)/adenine-specific DNA-methyltransferase